MSSRRVLKAAEAIREVVSMAILTELRDPRIRDVTVTHVEVSPDMRLAKVHVSVMGDDDRQQLSLKGLRNAAGFLQKKVGQRIDTRYTPRLRFQLDQGVKHSLEVSRILREVLPPDPDDVPDDDLLSDDLPADDLPADDGPADDGPLDDGPLDDGPLEAGDSEPPDRSSEPPTESFPAASPHDDPSSRSE